MKRLLSAASIFILSCLALLPHAAAAAAERCSLRVDSIDEDRQGFDSRPIWSGSLFSISLLANATMPTRASVIIYTIGGRYRVNLDPVRWYPTEVSQIYRSMPVPISFGENETFLHAGLIMYADSTGSHDCAPPQLFTAFNATPHLTLAPIQRATAIAAQPLEPRPLTMHGCAPIPVRIAVHAPAVPAPPPGAPVSGGPFISLIALRIDKTGAIVHTRLEVSSELPWLDQQSEAFARSQTYSPASFACKPAAGIYYFAGRFDTPNEGDIRTAF